MSASPAWAQLDPGVTAEAVAQKGFHSDRSYFSPLPFEHFDPINGNLVLSFVDLELPGNAGRPLRFQRTYNAQVREAGQTSRWTFGIAGMVMRVKDQPLVPTSFNFAGVPSVMMDTTPRFYGVDGSIVRTMYLDPPHANTPATLYKVTTPTFVRYDRSTGIMRYPDGAVAHYDSVINASGAVVGDGRLLDYADRYGNTVTLAYGANTLTVTQSLGTDAPRVITFALNGDGLPTQMDYSPGGELRRWTYDYTTASSQAGPQTDLEQVTPPEGTGWAYEYEGLFLTAVHTPQGGVVAYGYETRTVNLGGNPPRTEEITTLASRSSSDTSGQWQYSLDFDPLLGYSSGTIIETPTGTFVTYIHSPATSDGARAIAGGIVLVDYAIRDSPSPSATPIEREERTYQLVPSVVHYPSWWGTPEILTRRVTRDGREHTTTYSYNSNSMVIGNYHLPYNIVETSPDGTRTTYREFADNFTGNYWCCMTGLFYAGFLKYERVTIGSESFHRSWEWDSLKSVTKAYDYVPTSNYTVNGLWVTYTRDSYGNIATAKTGNDKPTSYSYHYGQVSEIRSPLHTTRRTINPDGTLASESQAGRTTTYAYDALGRPILEQDPGDVAPIVTTYDPLGHWVRVTRGAWYTETTLDGFGRPVATVDALGVRTATVYDAEGRVVQRSLPYVPGSGAGDVRDVTEYDVLGRVIRRVHADNSDVVYTYGPGTITITDENDHPTTQTWQVFGDPDRGRLTGVFDAKGQTWTYTYDAIDALRTVTAPGGTQRIWTYNQRHGLASEFHPESGLVTYNTYDSAGRLTRKTDARNTVFDLAYDDNGRLIRATAGNQVTQLGYEAGSDRRQWASVGRKDNTGTILDPTNTLFWYDAAGRLEGRQDTIDGRTFTSWYSFDDRDNIIALAYPAIEDGARRQIGFTYDSTGRRLTSVADLGAARNYASNFSYHPSGAVTQYEAGNGVVTTMSYDPYRYHVTGIQAGPLSLGYTAYDAAGNVTTLTDTRSGHTQTFEYDELHRLTSATGAYGVEAFNYDAHGNRVTVPGTNTMPRSSACWLRTAFRSATTPTET